MKIFFVIFFFILPFFIAGCKSSGPNLTPKKATPTNAPPPSPSTGPDPLLSHLWFLENTGQNAFSSTSGTVGADINLENLFDLGFGGKNIVVAVSDTNIEVDHEDLIANVSVPLSRNYLLSSSSAWPNSKPTIANNTDEHGTTVMGLIGAVANNGLGGRGVAPEVTLAGFNFISSNQSLSRFLDQARGFIDVFNYSYGTDTCSVVPIDSAYILQLKEGVTNQRSGKGSVYVKAGGNEYISSLDACVSGSALNYLGNANLEQSTAYPYMILAAGLTAKDRHASYSSPGSNIWISASSGENGLSAPGIISTDLTGCSNGYAQSSSTSTFDKGNNSLNSNCNYTATLQGTSFSSPLVSGVAALMLQANSNLTWRDVKHIMAATAVKIDPSSINLPHPLGENLPSHVYERGWRQNGAGFWFHNWYGFGKINASAAVLMAQTYTSTFDPFIETSFINSTPALNIPDNSSTGVSNTLNVPSSLIIEAVQISVNITHQFPSEIGIELTSPTGMISQLMLINSGIVGENLIDTQFLSNAFYGENSAGNWTIKIIDSMPSDTGILNSWKIKFFGHAP